MSRDVNVLGRPFKPVALGFCVSMPALAIYNYLDVGILGDSGWGDAIGAVAGISFVLLIGGWFWSKQQMTEHGLLLVFVAYLARALWFLFTVGLSSQSLWLSLSVVIIGGGSFFLEAVNPKQEQ